MDINEKVSAIVSDLSNIKENVLSLSEDIWLHINHNNNDEWQQAVNFKKESSEENKKIVVQLDKKTPHSLNEDYIFKRPYAFTLKGYAYKNVTTWKALFNQFCACLNKIDHNKMLETVWADEFISHKKKSRYFSTDKTKLHTSSKITDSVYAEVNMPANGFVKTIKLLLDFYNISYDEMKIYLREDRNA